MTAFALTAPGADTERSEWHGYRLVVMDPPWADDSGGGGRGAQDKYEVEDWPTILRIILECPHWQLDPRGAHVWIWYTSLARRSCVKLAAALGLRDTGYERIWVKGRVAEDGSLKRHIGLGQYGRMAHEYCRLFTVGRDVDVPRPLRMPSWRLEPARGGELTHSHKPDAFYDDAWAIAQCERERHGRAPALEMFARRKRAGWWTWGNEVKDG